MKDYNFFEIYQDKKRVQIDIKSPYFIGALVLLFCILFSIGLIARNMLLENKIEKLTDETIAVQSSKEFIEANRLQTSLDAMAEYDKNAETALNKFYNNQIIDTKLLNKIYGAIPNTAILVSFSINNTSTEMSFQIPNRKVASELMLSMKKTELFEEVQLISVLASQGGTGYMAYVSCILKEGEIQ